MTAGLCDFCGHPLAYLNHDACTPEGEASWEADHCPTHPDQPGGSTGAGDPWCGECRRAEREEHR